MRRDVIHYYEKNIAVVFEAYKAAAMQKFGKDCRSEPYHTISFGLNYSLKYNMNGGACTVHFMPYNTGTAVDVRYSIVQLAGARYGAHDKEMSTFVSSLIGVPVQDINIPAETFLLEQNKVTTPPPIQRQVQQPAQQPVQPVQQPVRQAQPVQPAQPVKKFCGKCGRKLTPGAVFCGHCGNKII
ncbi:MAG: zinc ribbon domain-containing protein [Clostridia bacterium]|nr:zinc ribbon domain-containing protein [Clostridia bacterium]